MMKRIPWGDLALWLISAFLVWVFAQQGMAKFSDTSGWARALALWHYPVWFRIVIGVLETVAAVLLLTRRTASIGAAIIVVVMLGAMGTHLYWGQARYLTSEVTPLTLASIVLVGRWRHFASWALRTREARVA